jgi:hypothetical protein
VRGSLPIRTRRRPDKGQPGKRGDSGQQDSSDQAPNQRPAVWAFELIVKKRLLPAVGGITACVYDR